MSKNNASQTQLAKAVLSYYWRNARRYKKYIAGLGIVLPLTVLANSTLPPIILADVLHRLSSGSYDAANIWGSFGWQLVAYGALVLSGGLVFWRVIDHIVWRLEGKVQRDMAREVFAHLTRQSADFHANNFGGSLVSKTNKLLSSYVRIADTTIFGVIPLILSLTFAVIVLSQTAWIFAIALFAFSIIYTASAFFITRRTRRLGAVHAALESAQTGQIADAITNVMTIKSFAGSKYEKSRFDKTTDATYQGLIDISRAHQRQQMYFSTMIGSITALSLVAAVLSVALLNVNVGAVFLIFNYTASITQQLFQFSNSALRSYNRAIGDAYDMVDILAQTPEVIDPATPQKSHIVRGDIHLKNVTFAHNGAKQPIFDELNLHIKPGEKVGLVGHSGSGKTTLTRILLRFSDIQSGTIAIDGQNIASVTQDDLHSHIAYVPQEPLLFHRSIAENIAYGDKHASQQAIEAVAKMANAHEFIADLQHGYDTLVGERGVKLSGGQRQRIAIARAMLKNAPIIVLDEATSALDSQSEVLIQDALWKLMQNRTAIVIAHRLSTIQKMDRILVMDNGHIIEQGSHNELLRLNGTYANLWNHQSGGFIEE